MLLGHPVVDQHCQMVVGNCAKRRSLRVLQDVEVTTPVVGKLCCLPPAVYVSFVVCPYMTNNPIEEEFRLTVPLEAIAIDFRHHEAVDA